MELNTPTQCLKIYFPFEKICEKILYETSDQPHKEKTYITSSIHHSKFFLKITWMKSKSKVMNTGLTQSLFPLGFTCRELYNAKTARPVTAILPQ